MRSDAVTKGERTRRQIVAAAAPMFNRRGYDGSTLSELMKLTGLEKGGIYRHFSGKDELAGEAFDYTWKAAREARLEGLKGKTGIGWLKQFIENFVARRSPVAGGCPILNTAVDADDGNPVLRARVDKALKSWRLRLQTVIRKAAQKGEIRAGVDPKAVATLLVATLEGALMMSRLEGSDAPLRTVQEHLNRYLDDKIAARPPAPGSVALQ